MNKIKGLIFWVIGILAISFIIVIFFMYQISNKACEEICFNEKALGHLVTPSGGFDLKDVCICIFENKIKAFRLGG